MKRLLIAATALTLMSSGAYAQISSNSGSTSTATNSSASQSSSMSNPQVNVYGNPIGNGASSSNSSAGASANTRSNSYSSATGNKSIVRSTTNIVLGTGSSGLTGGTFGTSGSGTSGTSGSGTAASSGSGGGDPTINYTGGYTVRNTPEVMPPSVVGGNTCAIGVSGGVALPGFGIAGGATWADKACERRQEAALLYNMGEHKVAYALMCQDDHVRQAMREVGEPCLQDRPVAAAPAPAVAAVAPPPAAAVAAAAPVVTPAAVRVAAVAKPLRAKPAWCTPATVSPAHLNTLSDGQRMYIHLQCGT